jgi:hypothetical protein
MTRRRKKALPAQLSAFAGLKPRTAILLLVCGLGVTVCCFAQALANSNDRQKIGFGSNGNGCAILS